MDSLFVQTPDANYCLGSDIVWESGLTSLWLQWGALAVFLLYMVRLRRVIVATARDEDDAKISTADYALQINGLDRAYEADDLVTALRQELEGLSDEHGECGGGEPRPIWDPISLI